MLTRKELREYRYDLSSTNQTWDYQGKYSLFSKIRLVSTKIGGADEIYISPEIDCNIAETDKRYTFVNNPQEPIDHIQQVATLGNDYRVYIDPYSPLHKVIVYNSNNGKSGYINITNTPRCSGCVAEEMREELEKLGFFKILDLDWYIFPHINGQQVHVKLVHITIEKVTVKAEGDYAGEATFYNCKTIKDIKTLLKLLIKKD